MNKKKSCRLSNTKQKCVKTPCNRGDCYRPTRSIRMVFLVPGIVVLTMLFLLWSMYSIYLNIEYSYTSSLLSGIIFCTVGSYLGVKEVESWRIHNQCCKELVTIPRTNSGVILVLMSVILKGFWCYFYVGCTDIPCWMYLLDMIVSSLVIGYLIAQLVVFFRKYLNMTC